MAQVIEAAAQLKVFVPPSHVTVSVLISVHAQDGDRTVFLSHLSGAWQDHCSQTQVLRSVFLYLDRTYAMQQAKVT